MKCTTENCRGDTKLIQTQSNEGTKHKPPEMYRDLKIIRRRRVCLLDPSHKFWTIELTEDFWSELVERVKL